MDWNEFLQCLLIVISYFAGYYIGKRMEKEEHDEIH